MHFKPVATSDLSGMCKIAFPRYGPILVPERKPHIYEQLRPTTLELSSIFNHKIEPSATS
jgi:hypothetical protein